MAQETIVMFPFMAQGHFNPFLALAHQLQQRTNYQIILVNTPLNIKKLRSSLPPNTCIRLVELPFSCADHGLPPDSENTDSLPYTLICRFLQASESLKPAFNQLILDITQEQEAHPPLCIIADMFFGWTVEIANELNIFHSIFLTGSAYGSAIYLSLWLHLPQCNTSSQHFSLPDFPEVSTLHRTQLANNLKKATGTDPWSLIVPKLLSLWLKADGILINTIEELDHIGLEYFRRKTGNRPIWPVVPTLYSSSPKKLHSQKKSGDLEHCLDWLNTQPPASVLFVSFGSQNTISSSQLMELAIGLETSGKNFIWVVRPPLGYDINGEFRSEWLPEGFEDRLKQGNNRGLIVRKWAPQLEILSHKATCAFLSHCGWNSVLESLSLGVPMIGWPLSAEQYYNSKLLEEVGVCVEVARGNDCEIKHEEMKRVIEVVMGGTLKGEEMKKKACEVKHMIEDAIREEQDYGGSSVKAIEEFIDTALFLRKTKFDHTTNKTI